MCLERIEAGIFPADFDCEGIEIHGPAGVTTGATPLSAAYIPDDPALYPVPDAPFASLVGRIDDGKPFAILDGGTFTAANTGSLQLRKNHSEVVESNTGAYVAVVVIADGD